MSSAISPVSLLVLHRHGDRSPLRGHSPDEELLPGARGRGRDREEGVRRGSKVPALPSAEEYWSEQLVPQEEVERLDRLYPVHRDPGEADPVDDVSAPFGCLTSTGLQQLKDMGQGLWIRYANHGIHQARVEAFSTNYRRTQLSAQGFLDGLRGGKGGIPVVVRPRAADFLNNWESRGREMTEMMLSVEADPSFRAREEAIGGPLKRDLNRLAPDVFQLAPGKRFRWMMAADYFMCARAHGLRIPADLDALGGATIRHLIWRFRKFYGDRTMLKTMIGPLLRHILECIEHSVPENGAQATEHENGGTIRRIVSSSCHDVTIMALLYALDSHLLGDDDFWSPYASTILFEVSTAKEAISTEGGNRGKDPRVLKILIDGQPLRSGLFPNSEGFVREKDFCNVIRDLVDPDSDSDSDFDP